MKVIECTSEASLITFNDKVMGVFENARDLDEFAKLLEGTSDRVETLEGPVGARCLKQIKNSVEGFLDAVLGDMESSMLKVYLKAIEKGYMVFAVPATAETRDEIVSAALQFGAKHVAHFGTIVNETFQTYSGDQPP